MQCFIDEYIALEGVTLNKVIGSGTKESHAFQVAMHQRVVMKIFHALSNLKQLHQECKITQGQ